MAKLAANMQAGQMPRFGAHIDGSRADYTYMSLKDLIANAYSVKPYQVSGPDWLATSATTYPPRCPRAPPPTTLPTCSRPC